MGFERLARAWLHITRRSKSVNSGFIPQYQIIPYAGVVVLILNTINTNKRIRMVSAEIFTNSSCFVEYPANPIESCEFKPFLYGLI